MTDVIMVDPAAMTVQASSSPPPPLLASPVSSAAAAAAAAAMLILPTSSSSPRHNSIELTAANTQSIADYLAQLLKDKKQLAALPNVFHHVERLLDEGKWTNLDE